MDAALRLDLRHLGAQVDPELRIALAKPDRRQPRHQSRKPERRQSGFIEAGRAFEIANADGDVVDHGYTWSFYRHCEPTGRANARPMTGSAKQSSFVFVTWIASSRSLSSGPPKAGPVGPSQ